MPGEEGEVNGLAWVKDGRVLVKDPKPGGKPASILPHNDIEILISGKRIYTEEPILSSSDLEVRLPTEEPFVGYKVEIVNGGLEAQAKIEVRDGFRSYLVDKPPTNRLELEYRTEPIKIAPDPQKLMEVIQQAGVQFGIDREAVESCRERTGRFALVVAKGKPPVPGKDGEIRFLVPLERVVDLPADELQIDFRNVAKFPDVKQGQAVAVKSHPVPGSPGTTVTGASIPPVRPKDPKFRAGKGIEFHERDGSTVAVAAVSGYPTYAEDSGIVSVDPVFTHKGDVDMASGNIRTSGSVCILGQVTEGMTVESEGSQEISGAVTEAVVKAWGSIRVSGNVFKSTLIAGKDSTSIRRMDEILRNVEQRVDAFLSIEDLFKEALVRHEAGTPELGDDAILDQTAQIERLRNLALAIAALLKEDLSVFPKEIQAHVRETREMLSMPEKDLFKRVRGISELLSGARNHVDTELMSGKSDVMLPYAQSSTVEASRDIIITGQGVFYCTLHAGRAIKTSGSPGLVRSGEARARELIQVNAAGGQGAAPTVLVVGVDGKISAATIYPNTVLTVGPYSYRTEDTFRSVNASLVEGRLVINTAAGPVQVD